jgi:drug/metabolite transporter (DMT)-like permease
MASVTRSYGLAELLVLGVLWGITFPVARVGVAGGASPLLLVLLDFAVAAACMAGFAAVRGTPRPAPRSMAQSAGLGALLIAGINLPLYWGLQFTTGGAASIVYATSPILSLVALWAMGTRPELGRRQLLALWLGLAGVVILGVAVTGSALAGGLIAIPAFVLGASCQGVGAVLVGRARPHGENPWGLTFQFVGGALASLAVLPFLSPAPRLPLTVPVLGSIAYVGLLSMAVGYTIFFHLIVRSGAVRANQVTFLNPIVALAIGVVAFGEGFQPLEAVALALIVLALLLLQPSRRPVLQRPTAVRLETARRPG